MPNLIIEIKNRFPLGWPQNVEPVDCRRQLAAAESAMRAHFSSSSSSFNFHFNINGRQMMGVLGRRNSSQIENNKVK